MKQKLEAEKGAMSDEDILDTINEMKSSSMKESNSLIEKGLSGVLIESCAGFYALDQLSKGEKMLKAEQKANYNSFLDTEREKMFAGSISR